MAVMNIKSKSGSSGEMIFYNKSNGTAILTIATTGVTIANLSDVTVDHTDSATFTVDNDSTTGKIKLSAVAGAANKTLTLQNAALTDNRTIEFPDASGTVSLSSSSSLVAGASGTAGTVTIYPATAANGTLILSCTNNGANKNITITNAAHAQDTQYNIPDCGAAVGQIPVVTSDHSVKITAGANATVTLPATTSITGNLSIGGAFTTAAAVTFAGAFAAQITVPSASTWVLPTGGGTLATTDGASTGTTASTFTVDTDSSNAKIALDTNSATGNFTAKIVPPATISADRTITLPDASDTMVGKATTDVLTNKTLTAPVVNGCTTAAAANNFTLNTGTGAFTTPQGTFTHYGNVTNNGNITFDFSGSNGTFKTSTGDNTFGGNVIISGTKTFASGTGTFGINGDATIAAGKDLVFAAGAGYLEMDGSVSGGIKLAPIGTGTALTTIQNANCAAATITLPNATATLATIGLSEALDLKSLTNASTITQTGAVTFTTGTGAVSINGSATVATTKTLTFGSAAAGTAIPITMYSLTGNKGALILQVTDAATDHATTLTNAALNGAAATITLPNATSTLSGIGLAETFSGVKTFSAAPLITIDDANNNTVTDLERLTHTTSGVPGAGIGVGITYYIEDLGGSEEQASFDVSMATVTDGAEDADLIWKTQLNGDVQQVLKVDSVNQTVVVGQNVSDADGVYKTTIYPVTSAKGSLVLQAVANNAADVQTIIQNGQSGATSTFTLPTAASGTIALCASAAGAIARADITEEALSRYQIELMKCRNANGTVMDATGGAGLFAITAGGWGSGTLVLTGEGANGNTKTDTFCTEFVLPPEYVADAHVSVIVNCKYAGAGTVGTKTIDVTVYELGDDGTAAAILASSPQAITTSYADYTFVVTDTGLTAGDRMMILVQGVLQETVSGGALTMTIGSMEVQCDIKG